MSPTTRWALGALLAALIFVFPAVHYRATYDHAKRLRVVTPGREYRCGQLTAPGFAEAVERFGIRTVLNLQDEFPDPDVEASWPGGESVKESDLCRRLGVRYAHIAPDLLPARQVPARRPVAIDRFLDLLDDPSAYPVLIHCRAGLHRTGVLTAVYRMEYEGWDVRAALAELKANGFGEHACNPANEYVRQYVLAYRPRQRDQGSGIRDQRRTSASSSSLTPDP
jgi:tyrosine-protein phosphatase SIW14